MQEVEEAELIGCVFLQHLGDVHRVKTRFGHFVLVVLQTQVAWEKQVQISINYRNIQVNHKPMHQIARAVNQ